MKSIDVTKRNIYFYSALIVTLSVVILLVTGAPVLTVALDSHKTIPLGTFITWAGMVSLPFTLYWGVKELRKPTTKLNSILSVCLKGIVVLGMLWVPLSYMLAGNLSFSFSERSSFQGGQTAMKWFWRLSYGIGIGTVLILLAYAISYFLRRRESRGNK